MLIKRPDLARAPWTSPELIGSKMYPGHNVLQNSGIIDYMVSKFPTLSGVTSGRASTTALDPTDNALSSLTFTLVSKEKRMFRSDRNVLPQAIENTKMELATAGKNLVAFIIEKARADAAYTGTPTASSTEAAFVTNVKSAVQTIRATGARVGIAMSNYTFDTISEYTAITGKIGKNITAPMSATVTPEDWASIQLAAIFGCREILIGQNIAWNASQDNAASVVVFAMPNLNLDMTAEAKLGTTVVKQEYHGDEMTPFICEEGYDQDRKGIFVDTTAFIDVEELNSDLKAIIALPAEATA